MAEGVKLLSAPGLKVRIAVGSAAVLLVGASIAPPATSTVEVSQERAAPLLEERIQLRESVRPFQGVDGAAAGVIPYGVAILPPPAVTPVTGGDFSSASSILLDSGFGVRISATEVVTHVDALDGRSTVRFSSTDGAVVTGTVAAYDASGICTLAHRVVRVAGRSIGNRDATSGGARCRGVTRNGAHHRATDFHY